MQLSCYKTRNALNVDFDYQQLKLKLAAERLAAEMADLLKPICNKIVETFMDIWEWLKPILRVPENSKVLYLSVHGNKWRTRKKNKKRLLKG